MPSRFATSYVACLQADIKWWTEHGGLPEIYNEISESVLNLFKQKGLTLQTAPPNDHRQNRAERAIGSAKPHFLANLATFDPSCPINLWQDILPQV